MKYTQWNTNQHPNVPIGNPTLLTPLMIIPTMHKFSCTYFDYTIPWNKQFIQTNDAPILLSTLLRKKNPMTCQELWKIELSEYLCVEPFFQQILTGHLLAVWVTESMAVSNKWSEGSKSHHENHVQHKRQH